jgi:hypothetical protein
MMIVRLTRLGMHHRRFFIGGRWRQEPPPSVAHPSGGLFKLRVLSERALSAPWPATAWPSIMRTSESVEIVRTDRRELLSKVWIADATSDDDVPTG